nr:MAG TPA: hypothetical protein [Caudoviricetes sp.]
MTAKATIQRNTPRQATRMTAPQRIACFSSSGAKTRGQPYRAFCLSSRSRRAYLR